MQQVEHLNKDGSGVVLLGHSMGNKVVRYFLQYMCSKYGRGWLDQHIHTWLAAGALHLGASQAVRATLLGDTMGLGAFLSLEEGLAIARSFGSSPWMFPLGEQAKDLFYMRRQGTLEISGLFVKLPKCRKFTRSDQVSIAFEVAWGNGETARLRSTHAMSFDGRRATFTEERNFFQFAGPEHLPDSATLVAVIRHTTYTDRCIGHLVCRGSSYVGGSEAPVVTGTPSLGSTTEARIVDLLREGEADPEGFVGIKLDMNAESMQDCGSFFNLNQLTRQHRGSIAFRLRWRSCEELWPKSTMRRPSEDSSSLIAPTLAMGTRRYRDGGSAGRTSTIQWEGKPAPELRHARLDDAQYDPVDCMQAFQLEGATLPIDVWRSLYEKDPLYDSKGSAEPPPIRRMLSVHGINIATEVIYALRLKTVRLDTRSLQTRFELDDDAKLVPGTSPYEMMGGIAYEMPNADRPSGDGVVPFDSMEHCKKWADSLELRVEHLEKGTHREMLSDKRFHQVLLRALVPSSRKTGASFSPKFRERGTT